MPSINRLALGTLLGAEAVALFMLAAFLASTSSDGPLPPFFIFPAALAGGFALTRLLLRFDVPLLVQGAGGVVVTALWLLILLTLAYDPGRAPLSFVWLVALARDPEAFLAGHWAETWGVIALTVAWFRGVTLAQREVSAASAVASFGTGLLLALALLLFGQGTRARGAIDAAVLPYFVLGLLTLALLQLDQAEQQRTAVPRGPWLATLGGTVGVLVLISVAIGAFPLDALNTLLAPVGRLTLWLLDILIFIIAYPLALVLGWLFSLLTGGRALDFPRLNEPASRTAEELAQRSEQHILLTLLFVLVKVIFLLALAAVIGYLLWRVFRRLHRPPAAAGELRETIEGEGSLGGDLSDLLRGLGRRLRPRRAVVVEPALPADVLAVRRVYLRALDRAEQSGAPRPPSATPVEFAPRLGDALHTPAAEALSARFAAARYGLTAPSGEELAALEREVERSG